MIGDSRNPVELTVRVAAVVAQFLSMAFPLALEGETWLDDGLGVGLVGDGKPDELNCGLIGDAGVLGDLENGFAHGARGIRRHGEALDEVSGRKGHEIVVDHEIDVIRLQIDGIVWNRAGGEVALGNGCQGESEIVDDHRVAQEFINPGVGDHGLDHAVMGLGKAIGVEEVWRLQAWGAADGEP